MLNEGHKEISSGKRKDSEGYMAKNELDKIERSIKDLRKTITSPDQQLPAWVQSKITKAADYINTASEYLQSDEESMEEEKDPCWKGYKQVGMKKKGRKEVPNCVPESAMPAAIDPKKHRQQQRSAKIRTLAQKGSTEGERAAAEKKTKGPKMFGENNSLVDEILSEIKDSGKVNSCKPGYYWCYEDKKCKKIPMGWHIGRGGYLAKDEEDSEETKTTDGNGETTSNGNGGSDGGGVGESIEILDANGKQFAEIIDLISVEDVIPEDLRQWFGKGKKGGVGGGGWDRYNSKGERIGKCAREDEDGDGDADGPKPKCLSKEKAAKMSKKEIAASVRDKREEDPVADRKSKGGKPVFVKNRIKEEIEQQRYCPKCKKVETQKECAFGPAYWSLYSVPSSLAPVQEENKCDCDCGKNPCITCGKNHHEVKEEYIEEKNKPTNPALWSRAKALAKKKFDVYPSAYANGWASKWYKERGGKWESSESVDEQMRINGKNGNILMVVVYWRGKSYTTKLFFPQMRLPSKMEVNDEMQKIYPGCRVIYFKISDLKPNEPLITTSNSKSKNYLLNNKTIGESIDKDKMKCNKPKSDPVGDSKTGKSHVVKACEGGKEKIIRFGQRGVKGSPKKEGESDEYASRRNRFKSRHAKNIKKGKMSAAYWANKVKW